MNKSDKKLTKYIDQSIKIKEKIPLLHREINKAIKLIYKTIKLKKKFLYVVMEALQLMLNI
mgnify:CR=1 FL=1